MRLSLSIDISIYSRPLALRLATSFRRVLRDKRNFMHRWHNMRLSSKKGPKISKAPFCDCLSSAERGRSKEEHSTFLDPRVSVTDYRHSNFSSSSCHSCIHRDIVYSNFPISLNLIFFLVRFIIRNVRLAFRVFNDYLHLSLFFYFLFFLFSFLSFLFFFFSTKTFIRNPQRLCYSSTRFFSIAPEKSRRPY